MKVPHLDPTIERSIRIFRNLEEVFKPRQMTFKELKEKINNGTHQNVSTKKEKPQKNINSFFLCVGMVNYSRNFAMCGGSWNPTSAKSE
jgi:hypothetical protein